VELVVTPAPGTRWLDRDDRFAGCNRIVSVLGVTGIHVELVTESMGGHRTGARTRVFVDDFVGRFTPASAALPAEATR
jgi:hypothetical protein